MDTAAIADENAWTIVCDDSCPVVRFLAKLIKAFDQRQFFHFVGQEDQSPPSQALIAELATCPWSLLLIDDQNEHWQGPEAIPFILKNLPGGRLAVVAYLIPGTMWITRQLYYLISRHRKKFSKITLSKNNSTAVSGN